MVIEGTLALTGQNFITRAFEERGILPGFTEGFRRIATDEHRHVAYGTWFLQQKAADPGLRRRIADRLVALLPTTAGVLVPPGADPDELDAARLRRRGDQHVRVHRAHAPAQGDRRGPRAPPSRVDEYG